MTSPTLTLPQPAAHPLLNRRAQWLLVGRDPQWLRQACAFAESAQGPLMRWRAAQGLVQVVHADHLTDALERLLGLAPADFTLACQPGMLHEACNLLDRTLPNLMHPLPRHAMRVSEQATPFEALLPRLQQPEPALAALWFNDPTQPWATWAEQVAAAAGSADPSALPMADPARVLAAEAALCDWAEEFASYFAPGEMEAIYGPGDLVPDLPLQDQPEPATWGAGPQPRPQPLPGRDLPAWPQPASGLALLAAAPAALPLGQAQRGSAKGWPVKGRWPTSTIDGDELLAGQFILTLTGTELRALLTFAGTAVAATNAGRPFALVVQSANGLSLRLRGNLSPSATQTLSRTLDATDAAHLRASPADSVTARFFFAHRHATDRLSNPTAARQRWAARHMLRGQHGRHSRRRPQALHQAARHRNGLALRPRRIAGQPLFSRVADVGQAQFQCRHGRRWQQGAVGPAAHAQALVHPGRAGCGGKVAATVLQLGGHQAGARHCGRMADGEGVAATGRAAAGVACGSAGSRAGSAAHAGRPGCRRSCRVVVNRDQQARPCDTPGALCTVGQRQPRWQAMHRNASGAQLRLQHAGKAQVEVVLGQAAGRAAALTGPVSHVEHNGMGVGLDGRIYGCCRWKHGRCGALRGRCCRFDCRCRWRYRWGNTGGCRHCRCRGSGSRSGNLCHGGQRASGDQQGGRDSGGMVHWGLLGRVDKASGDTLNTLPSPAVRSWPRH